MKRKEGVIVSEQQRLLLNNQRLTPLSSIELFHYKKSILRVIFIFAIKFEWHQVNQIILWQTKASKRIHSQI